MTACHHSRACSLDRCVTTGAALRVWQSFYCEGVFERCERFKLIERGQPIPDLLLPNGRVLERKGSGAGRTGEKG